MKTLCILVYPKFAQERIWSGCAYTVPICPKVRFLTARIESLLGARVRRFIFSRYGSNGIFKCLCILIYLRKLCFYARGWGWGQGYTVLFLLLLLFFFFLFFFCFFFVLLFLFCFFFLVSERGVSRYLLSTAYWHFLLLFFFHRKGSMS